MKTRGLKKKKRISTNDRLEDHVVQMRRLNDIDQKNWKTEIERNGLLLDSLWTFSEREKSGVHNGSYWGNFVPQVPHQAIIRFTRKNEWVLDLFAGSATSLIKCKQLSRNGIGIELVPQVAAAANRLLREQSNPSVYAKVISGDSASTTTRNRVRALLKAHNASKAHLLILHPPYYNAIHFSKDPRDLSNASSLENYLKMLRAIINNFATLLEEERYLMLVIGDLYSNREYIPLESKVVDIIQETGLFKLKGKVVKNITGNRGKKGQEGLWNYRALKNGLFIFKHEYVVFFQKMKTVKRSSRMRAENEHRPLIEVEK